jgi:hypothetical protein
MEKRKWILLLGIIVLVCVSTALVYTQDRGNRQWGGRDRREMFMRIHQKSIRGSDVTMELSGGYLIVISSRTIHLVDPKSFRIQKSRSMIQTINLGAEQRTPKLDPSSTYVLEIDKPYMYVCDGTNLLKYQIPDLKLANFLELKPEKSEAAEAEVQEKDWVWRQPFFCVHALRLSPKRG